MVERNGGLSGGGKVTVIGGGRGIQGCKENKIK
jgi:hypothetical protein